MENLIYIVKKRAYKTTFKDLVVGKTFIEDINDGVNFVFIKINANFGLSLDSGQKRRYQSWSIVTEVFLDNKFTNQIPSEAAKQAALNTLPPNDVLYRDLSKSLSTEEVTAALEAAYHIDFKG